MIAALMGLTEGTENKQILTDGSIPHFMYAELAVRTLEAMYRFRDWVDAPEDNPERFDVDLKKVSTFSNRVASASPTISIGLFADPYCGITFAIASLEVYISAISNSYFEHTSVEIIAGPPAFDTITTPVFFPLIVVGGIGCFEKTVDISKFLA